MMILSFSPVPGVLGSVVDRWLGVLDVDGASSVYSQDLLLGKRPAAGPGHQRV